jgi:hypothetical protein
MAHVVFPVTPEKSALIVTMRRRQPILFACRSRDAQPRCCFDVAAIVRLGSGDQHLRTVDETVSAVGRSLKTIKGRWGPFTPRYKFGFLPALERCTLSTQADTRIRPLTTDLSHRLAAHDSGDMVGSC